MLVIVREIQKNLGYGFSGVIDKDAMEQDFLENEIPHVREDELSVNYKGKTLKHKFKSDFTLFNNIIVEVKSGEDGMIETTIPQMLNYLKISGCRVGLIINFGKSRLAYMRLAM